MLLAGRGGSGGVKSSDDLLAFVDSAAGGTVVTLVCDVP